MRFASQLSIYPQNVYGANPVEAWIPQYTDIFQIE